MKLKLPFRRMDPGLLIMIFILTAYGLVMVFSASAPSAFYIHNDSMYFFKKQALWAGVGIVVMFITAAIDYKILKKYAMFAYVSSMALMLLVPFIGTSVKGAKRWLNLGITTIQPSEIAKITVILMCAIILSNIDQLNIKKSMQPLIGAGIVLGVTAILLLLQPHFSAVLIIGLSVAVMMVVAGVPLKLFAPVGALVAAAGAVIAIIEPYRLKRLVSFLNPFADKMGDGWQVVQSLYAIGSGGLTGLGLGRSRQKFLYIPEPQNDFIFSIICEELGFIGAMLVVVFFAILCWRAIKIALKAPDRFGMLLTFGLVAITIVQVILNIAVTTSSVPPTGIPLPFFSAGGTSFVFQMISMGIILNVSTQEKSG